VCSSDLNRVPGNSRDDISEVKVDQRAYLANFKIEPRYFINDSLMAGVFYDAGRVFVNQVDMGQLRDSVGLTFKVLTPVGSLDFDYGIKLLRERNKNGTLEDPGRFHVSIGFF
jgi:outer membrane protein insertion porin family